MRLVRRKVIGPAMAVLACGSPFAGPLPGEGTETPPLQAETAKLITEDAPTVEPGKTEIELGWQLGGATQSFDDDGQVVSRGTLEGQLFLLKATHGLKNGLDVAVGVLWRDVIRDDDDLLDRGEGNVVANIKWRIYESGRTGVALSWLSGFVAPFSVSSENEPILSPGQDFWSFDNLFALTIPGRRLNGSFDAGYILPLGDRRDEARGVLEANAAMGYQVCRTFQPIAELNYAHGYIRNEPDSDSLAATVGAVLSLSSVVRLDLGAQQIIAGRNAARASAFVANLSITF